MEVAVIDSGDCEAWHRARGIKLTLYKEMVTLFPICLMFDVLDLCDGKIAGILLNGRCVRDTKRVAGMLVRFSYTALYWTR